MLLNGGHLHLCYAQQVERNFTVIRSTKGVFVKSKIYTLCKQVPSFSLKASRCFDLLGVVSREACRNNKTKKIPKKF